MIQRAIGWWETSQHVGGLANFIQVTTGFVQYVAYGFAIWKIYELSCDGHVWCLRHGRHRVGRRHYCTKHHPAPHRLED